MEPLKHEVMCQPEASSNPGHCNPIWGLRSSLAADARFLHPGPRWVRAWHRPTLTGRSSQIPDRAAAAGRLGAKSGPLMVSTSTPVATFQPDKLKIKLAGLMLKYRRRLRCGADEKEAEHPRASRSDPLQTSGVSNIVPKCRHSQPTTSIHMHELMLD